MAVVLPIAAVIGAAVVVAGRLVVRSRRAPVTASGQGLLLGQVTLVRRHGEAPAQAFVEGAWWTVRSTGPSPPRDGSTVRVVGLEGLDLIVEPDVPDAPPGPLAPPADAADPTHQPQERIDP
jgi:membrane-bound serine protease (ClpP class)